ncbi:MAG: carboxymuconolactone decarboxylase family protein [Armatimonadetes bacterium]|nr:carboxymuconolactone decarboxylase family protein [Armatimonadota bacterium]
MADTNPMQLFQQEAPAVAAGFDALIQSLIGYEGLDGRTKQLIYIALKAAAGDATAVGFHAPMAKLAGATRDEVKGAVLMTLTTCGLRGVTTCLQAALDGYDDGNTPS